MNTEPFLDVTALEKLMQIGGKEFAGPGVDPAADDARVEEVFEPVDDDEDA